MDPRKPIRTLDRADSEAAIARIYPILLAACRMGADELGTSSASFMNIAMAAWAREFAEVSPADAAQYFRAMGDLLDPTASEGKRARASRRRRAALSRLLARMDLEMSEPEGRG